MPTDKFFHLDEQSGQSSLHLTGDWTVQNFACLTKILKQFSGQTVQLDLSQIDKLDTAGVLQLVDSFGEQAIKNSLQDTSSISEVRRQMIETVLQALSGNESMALKKPSSSLIKWLADVGESVISFQKECVHWVGFLGRVLQAFFSILFQPKRWRLTSVIANIDHSGLQAVPIVMLLCFMVGAVVAFLGATVLQSFGAEVFAVHLVAYSFLREFAIILTAILIAGRTASAFTAQIGSMKVNEEIDALKATGIDPIALLVVPRVLALVMAMPLLTFLGMIAGMIGGMLVCWLSMDISPTLFFDILSNNIAVKHFFVGISKAPLMAVVIAITGCIEGFKVTGSAESVGQHTTASVVKCIFLVILLDALCAIFFMEMGW